MKKKKLTKEDKNYLLKLKRRFVTLENKEYTEISTDELKEMQDIREELIKLGYGEWHR